MRPLGPPVPRLTLARYLSTFADNTRPPATGQRFIAAASRNELTTIARTANPKPPITSATTRRRCIPAAIEQGPRFMRPDEPRPSPAVYYRTVLAFVERCDTFPF